jgi:hypothetical protein
MNRFRSQAPTLLAFGLLIVSVGHGRAQTGTSAIRGQALDSQSRAFPGARVTFF